jgi:hypothetical protein
VERDVLPHHFRDGVIDLEPAMLAVLGVLPREKPVPGGVVLRGHFHGGPAHGQLAPSSFSTTVSRRWIVSRETSATRCLPMYGMT